jgi:hypothetical protein
MRKVLFYAGIIMLATFTGCSKEKKGLVSVKTADESKNGNVKTSAIDFIHPGTVLTKPQMQYAYAQAMANVEPYKTTFANFQNNYATFLSSSYAPHAHAQVGRNLYKSDYENDAMAMFVNGVMWNMTGQPNMQTRLFNCLMHGPQPVHPFNIPIMIGNYVMATDCIL